tara:strand:- start:3472 stop:3618 length:147 start_codon:yes stop_codon:yes gene_type:complete
MNINLNDVEISILNMALKNIHGPDVDRLKKVIEEKLDEAMEHKETEFV